MKVILGTSNITQRPPPRDIKSEGARLTEVLARRVAAQEAEEEMPAPRPTLRGKEKSTKSARLMGKQPKAGSGSAPSSDPLAWAKAAAVMRGWKPQRRT